MKAPFFEVSARAWHAFLPLMVALARIKWKETCGCTKIWRMLNQQAAQVCLQPHRSIFKPLQLIDSRLSLISGFGEESFMQVGWGASFIEHEGQIRRIPWQYQGHCSAGSRTKAESLDHQKCCFHVMGVSWKQINQADNEAFPQFLWHFSNKNHLCFLIDNKHLCCSVPRSLICLVIVGRGRSELTAVFVNSY